MAKIRIVLSDPKTQAIWEAIEQARVTVESWPPSKRGEDGPIESESGLLFYRSDSALGGDLAEMARRRRQR